MVTNTCISCVVLDYDKYINEEEVERVMDSLKNGEPIALETYLSQLMESLNNPCCHLVRHFAVHFKSSFENVLSSKVQLESDDLKLIQKHTEEGVFRILRTLHTIFPEFSTCKEHQLACNISERIVRRAYYGQVHPVLMSLVTKIVRNSFKIRKSFSLFGKKCAKQNEKYNASLKKLNKVTVEELGVCYRYQLKKMEKESPENGQPRDVELRGTRRYNVRYTQFVGDKFKQPKDCSVSLGIRFSKESKGWALKKHSHLLLSLFEAEGKSESTIYIALNGFYFNAVKFSVIWFHKELHAYCQLEFDTPREFVSFQDEVRSFHQKSELIASPNPFGSLHHRLKIVPQNLIEHEPIQPTEESFPYKKAADYFSNLSTLTNPEEKFNCVKKTLDLIASAVDDFVREQNLEERNLIGADDLIPILSYVIAKSKVENLPTEITYMQEFCDDPVGISKGESGYLLVSLQTCLDYLHMLSSKK